jgi:hypothetical protein
MEEVFTLPHCFFLGMIAPLDLKELNRHAPCDMILLIQDPDGVLEIGQVHLEGCHIRQYNIHMCLQALL